MRADSNPLQIVQRSSPGHMPRQPGFVQANGASPFYLCRKYLWPPMNFGARPVCLWAGCRSASSLSDMHRVPFWCWLIFCSWAARTGGCQETTIPLSACPGRPGLCQTACGAFFGGNPQMCSRWGMGLRRIAKKCKCCLRLSRGGRLPLASRCLRSKRPRSTNEGPCWPLPGGSSR